MPIARALYVAPSIHAICQFIRRDNFGYTTALEKLAGRVLLSVPSFFRSPFSNSILADQI